MRLLRATRTPAELLNFDRCGRLSRRISDNRLESGTLCRLLLSRAHDTRTHLPYRRVTPRQRGLVTHPPPGLGAPQARPSFFIRGVFIITTYRGILLSLDPGSSVSANSSTAGTPASANGSKPPGIEAPAYAPIFAARGKKAVL